MINNKKIILGFVGDLASGKGTISKYLEEHHQAHTYRFSSILRDLLTRLYIPHNRENLQNISTVLRSQFGQDVLSKVIAEDVKNDTSSIIAIDGIRRPTDIAYLKEVPGFHLLYLTADQKIRWQRLVQRNENEGDAAKSLEDFEKDENAEADRLIKELGSTAEFVITNNKSLSEFYDEIEQVLVKLGYADKN
jgi:dephospho-CoA kinase